MSPETLLNISLIILFLPALSFGFLIFFGKRLGRTSGIIGTVVLGIDLLLSLAVAIPRLVNYSSEAMFQYKIEWFNLGASSISIGIGIDNLAAIMLIIVTLISFLVHLFSLEYMRDDARFSRFYAYLSIFSFSMLGIVIANNFLNMFIFWEMVGLSSYLLIGFWFEKDSAANAGKKAFIVNRIGDFGFLIGLMIIYTTYQTFMFDDVFGKISQGTLPFNSGAWLTAMGILVFCGAIGKSAQFPLHVWLPDAMEGPTPVSALIHAATMVAAGVYLTARVFPMFTADALLFIAYIGAITALLAATIAFTQTDFKRVLAYSTVSQLGYMVMGLGVGAFTSGFMHLMTHAWFKALLFLASGSVIHAMHHSMDHLHNHDLDPQDIRNMGGLRKTMPITYITFLIATLTISGIPLTSGFLSKDGILAGTLAFGQLSGHWFIPIAGFFSAMLTAFYMFRLTIVSFHGEPRTEVAKHTKENNGLITFPLILLAVLSFWVFYSFNPLDSGKGWFAQRIKTPESVVPASLQREYMLPEGVMAGSDAVTAETNSHNLANETGTVATAHQSHTKFEEYLHHAHYPAMGLSLLMALTGLTVAFLFYQFKTYSPGTLIKLYPGVYKGSLNKWYFDEFYQATAVNGTIGLAKVSAWFDLHIIDGIVNFTAAFTRGLSHFIGLFDNGFIDGLVNLSARIVGWFGQLFRKPQTGIIQTYLVLSALGLIILLIIFL